jgi:hypothetical protein
MKGDAMHSTRICVIGSKCAVFLLIIAALGAILVVGCSRKKRSSVNAEGTPPDYTVEELVGYYRTEADGPGDAHDYIEINADGSLANGRRVGGGDISMSINFEIRGSQIFIQPKAEISVNDEKFKADPIIYNISEGRLTGSDGKVYKKASKPKSIEDEPVTRNPPVIVSAQGLGGTVVFRTLGDGIGPLLGTNRRTLFVTDSPRRVYGWMRLTKFKSAWGEWTQDKGWQPLASLSDASFATRDAIAAVTPSGQIIGLKSQAPYILNDARVPQLLPTLPADDAPRNFNFGDGKAVPLDVTPDGKVIVGWSWAKVESGLARRAVRWTTGNIERLADPPGKINFTLATAVSGDGKVVGGKWITESNVDKAVLWTADGKVTVLGNNWQPNFINYDGSVVLGEGRRSSGTFGAVRWTAADGLTDLAEFPPAPKDPDPGKTWGGTMPSNGCSSQLYGASADRKIGVGQAGVVIPKIPKPTDGSFPFTSSAKPVLWTPDGKIVDILSLLTTDLKMDLQGCHLYLATDISPDGSAVVGLGRNAKEEFDAWLIELPPGWWTRLP